MTGGKDEFYRAPTGIDEGTHESDYDDIWRAEGLDRLKRKYSQYRLSVPKIRCFLKCRLPIPLSRTTQYSLPLILCIASAGGNGAENEVTNNSGLETIARVGQSFCLPAAFDTLTWYGKGPWETYADRKDAAFTGFCTSSVAEQHVPFVVPCECGGHEDTRFAILSDGTHTVQIGRRVMISISVRFHILWQNIEKPHMREELPEHTTGTWLILDAAHAGLSGDYRLDENIHPEYRVCKGRYSYTFRFHFA